MRARLHTRVEREAARDAPALVGAERCLVVRMALRFLERIDQTDGRELRPVGRGHALLGGVLQAEVDGIDAELLGHLVHH